MNYRKQVSMMFAVLVIVSLVSACAPPAAAPTTQVQQPAPAAQQPTAATKPLRVALVLGGVINDAGIGASAYQGMQDAKTKLGIDFGYSENVTLTDAESTFRDYASQGYDLIIANAGLFADPVLKVAKDFPNTRFAVTNAGVSAENVAGIDTKNEESGYMAGIVAGTLTKTKKVGFVLAEDIMVSQRAKTGYELGVKQVCPDCQVLNSFTGSWSDIAKGKETATALIDQGADVLFQYADASGLGAIQAAKERNIMMIGSGLDQSSLAPDNVVTTTLQYFAPMIYNIIADVQSGNFKANTVALNGYDTGAYDLAPLNDKLVTPEQKASILGYLAKMKAGEITLPHLTK